MKLIPLFLLILLPIPLTFAKPLGTGWDTVLDSCSGDLDKDGVPEKVQVVKYPMDKDSITVLELQIIKKKPNGQDSLWFASCTPLNSYRIDEELSNSFNSVRIQKGVLLIDNEETFPESNISNCTKYRFQNESFHLIGLTVNKLELGCKYFTQGIGLGYEASKTVDINFSTGKGVFSGNYDGCDENEDDKIPKDKSIPFTLDQCSATKTVNGKEQKLTTSDLKNITIANHKYGEISLTIKGESISF